MNSYIQLLRLNPGFTRLWLAQVISLLGDWFSTIVLSIMVRQFTANTDYAGLAISALFLAQLLPPLLMSPFAGELVDRFDRKTLLWTSNALRAVVMLGFLLIRGPELLWLLYTLRVTQFVLSSVFEPGQSALLPSLVRPEDLTLANTLFSITWSVMLAVGAITGGLVGALLGANAALIIDALTFVIAAAIIFSIRVQPAVNASPQPVEQVTNERSFLAALRYVRRHPDILATLGIKFGGSVGNMDTLITFYATQIFVLGANGSLSLGIMYAAFGLGALLGPLVANRFHNGSIFEMRRSVLVGFVLVLCGWLSFGLAPVLAAAAGAMMVRAMGNSINWVYSTTMLQKTVPDSYLGRVFALDMGGYYLASVLSAIAHGQLIDIYGSEHIRQIVYGTALVSLIPLLLWIFAIWRLEARERQRQQALISTS